MPAHRLYLSDAVGMEGFLAAACKYFIQVGGGNTMANEVDFGHFRFVKKNLNGKGNEVFYILSSE